MSGSQIIFFIVGLLFGSFGGVLVDRIPKGKSPTGRSKCPHCEKKLGATELIPVVSYMVLQGKCLHCKKSISIICPLAELGTGLLFIFALSLSSSLLEASLLALIFWLLLLITIVDAKTQLIPDLFNVPFLMLALCFHFLIGDFDYTGIGLALAFFGFQWGISFGKWVGSGDVLFAAGMGLLLRDWQMVAVALFISYVTGFIFISIGLLISKLHRKSHIAFGPFLVIGTIAALVYGERIIAILI